MLRASESLPVVNTYELPPSLSADEPDSRRALSLADFLTAALEEIDYGLMVLHPLTRRLQHANRLALRECLSGAPLTMEAGRVNARDTASRVALERALTVIASDRRSLISLHGEKSSCNVAVIPITDLHGVRQALLIFSKQAVCEQLSVSFYARLHALTPTEDEVLKALCRGLRPAEIARETGVKISTVRTQVTSIRAKTRTTSIQDLVRTMAALPPINTVLRGAGRRVN